MNKNIWFVVVFILLAILGYFLFTNPTIPPEITFNEVKESTKLPPPAPIVKDIQLDNLIVKEAPQENLKRDLRKSKREVENRKSACEKNSKELFSKAEFYRNPMAQQLAIIFEKTLSRKESNKAFLKIQELLNSDITIDLNIYYSLLFSLEICRPKKSMEFLDKTIESLKGVGGDNELARALMVNIRENLLGDQYSPVNLSLVFGKLGRLVDYNVIKGPSAREIMDLREHFLNYENEVNRNLKRSEGNEQLRDLTIEHFAELREISVELKNILEGI